MYSMYYSRVIVENAIVELVIFKFMDTIMIVGSSGFAIYKWNSQVPSVFTFYVFKQSCVNQTCMYTVFHKSSYKTTIHIRTYIVKQSSIMIVGITIIIQPYHVQ